MRKMGWISELGKHARDWECVQNFSVCRCLTLVKVRLPRLALVKLLELKLALVKLSGFKVACCVKHLGPKRQRRRLVLVKLPRLKVAWNNCGQTLNNQIDPGLVKVPWATDKPHSAKKYGAVFWILLGSCCVWKDGEHPREDKAYVGPSCLPGIDLWQLKVYHPLLNFRWVSRVGTSLGSIELGP